MINMTLSSLIHNFTIKQLSDKSSLTFCYVSLILGSFFVLPLIVSLIWAALCNPSDNYFLASHKRFVLRTLLFSALSMLICAVLTYFIIGYFLFFVAWAWLLYRSVFGAINAFRSLPMYKAIK